MQLLSFLVLIWLITLLICMDEHLCTDSLNLVENDDGGWFLCYWSQYFDEEFCMYVHQKHWANLFLFCCIDWLGYQHDVSLIDLSLEEFPPFQFLKKKFEENCLYFFKCLVEFSSEVTGLCFSLLGDSTNDLVLLLIVGLFGSCFSEIQSCICSRTCPLLLYYQGCWYKPDCNSPVIIDFLWNQL